MIRPQANPNLFKWELEGRGPVTAEEKAEWAAFEAAAHRDFQVAILCFTIGAVNLALLPILAVTVYWDMYPYTVMVASADAFCTLGFTYIWSEKLKTVVHEFLIKPIEKGEWRQIPYRLGRKLNDLTSGRWDDCWRNGHGTSVLAWDGIIFPKVSLRWEDLFKEHYGVFPRYYKIVEWTNYPSSPTQGDFWHRDNESSMTMKVFTYLNDVGPKQGPHQYLIASHRDIVKSYRPDQPIPTDRILTVLGPAGTTFVEIPHGLHRSTPVKEGERKVRQVFFSYYWRPDTERI